MCTLMQIMKKTVSGVVGGAVAVGVGKINKVAGIATGAATFVAADLGLDYLTSKIELDKIRKESEELTTPDVVDDEFDFNCDYSDAAEEGVTVETVIRTQETIEAETKTEETHEEKPLSPLEEDKQKAKELKLDELEDDENKSLNSYPASKQPTRKNK